MQLVCRSLPVYASTCKIRRHLTPPLPLRIPPATPELKFPCPFWRPRVAHAWCRGASASGCCRSGPPPAPGLATRRAAPPPPPVAAANARSCLRPTRGRCGRCSSRTSCMWLPLPGTHHPRRGRRRRRSSPHQPRPHGRRRPCPPPGALPRRGGRSQHTPISALPCRRCTDALSILSCTGVTSAAEHLCLPRSPVSAASRIASASASRPRRHALPPRRRRPLVLVRPNLRRQLLRLLRLQRVALALLPLAPRATAPPPLGRWRDAAAPARSRSPPC